MNFQLWSIQTYKLGEKSFLWWITIEKFIIARKNDKKTSTLVSRPFPCSSNVRETKFLKKKRKKAFIVGKFLILFSLLLLRKKFSILPVCLDRKSRLIYLLVRWWKPEQETDCWPVDFKGLKKAALLDQNVILFFLDNPWEFCFFSILVVWIFDNQGEKIIVMKNLRCNYHRFTKLSIIFE